MEENVKTGESTEVKTVDEAKAAKVLEKKKNKTKKTIILTTYFITVLCLLAGLLVPLFQFKTTWADGTPLKLVDNMMLKYIPYMTNMVTAFVIKKEFVPTDKLLSWFAREVPQGTDIFLAFICVLYAVVCVIAILMFIPILFGSKKKNTSANCALWVELLALLVTTVYIAYNTYFIVNNGIKSDEEGIKNVIKWTDFNFLIPFGGALIMAIIQTVTSKKSIGVSKVIALLLSALGVVALCDLTLFIPALKTPLSKFSNLVKCGEEIGFLFGLESPAGEQTILGIDGLNVLLNIKNVWPTLIMPKDNPPDVFKIIVYILLIGVAVLTLLNMIVDIIGLSTGKLKRKDKLNNVEVYCRNAASNTFALVRYILTFVFAAAIVILSMFAPSLKGTVKVGIYLYVLLAVLLIEIVNAAIRTAVANARAKKGEVKAINTQEAPVIEDTLYPPIGESVATEAQPYETYQPEQYQAPVQEYVAAPEYVPEDYAPAYVPEPIAVPEPLTAPLEEPEEPAEGERAPLYYYNGATDEFMDTLSDNEKVEFVEMFVKRSKGKVNGVPDYEINGDNSDFFPSVFVHINRYRNIVSDALMSKMYKQLGKSM